MKKMKLPLFGFFFMFALVLMSGCTKEQFKATTDLSEFQEKYKEKEMLHNQSGLQVFSPVDVADEHGGDYKLGPGDLIYVKVYESDELDAEARVSSRGFVSLPLLGNVDVNNLSPAEAGDRIEELYMKDYIQDPHVSVHIKEHVSRQITLVGAVKNPGTYEYVIQQRLLDVLAIGGGLSEESGSTAYIDRKKTTDQERVRYMVDLDALLKKGDIRQNITILGGDVIFVPESGQFFVDGAVRRPGTYQLKSKITVTEAIALAGGLASFADDDGIKLIRYMSSGQDREIVSLSYSDLQGGVGDTLLLQDQDVIFAESSATGLLMSGSGFSVGFMGTGFTFKNPEAMMDRR